MSEQLPAESVEVVEAHQVLDEERKAEPEPADAISAEPKVDSPLKPLEAPEECEGTTIPCDTHHEVQPQEEAPVASTEG